MDHTLSAEYNIITQSSDTDEVVVVNNNNNNYQSSIIKKIVIARRLGTRYVLPKTAAEIIKQTDFIPQCIHRVTSPLDYCNYQVSVWSDIGIIYQNNQNIYVNFSFQIFFFNFKKTKIIYIYVKSNNRMKLEQ